MAEEVHRNDLALRFTKKASEALINALSNDLRAFGFKSVSRTGPVSRVCIFSFPRYHLPFPSVQGEERVLFLHQHDEDRMLAEAETQKLLKERDTANEERHSEKLDK